MLLCLPKPVQNYLERLELGLKQKIGIIPEDALYETRAKLIESYDSITRADLSCPDDEIYQRLIAEFGEPSVLSESFQSLDPPGSRRHRRRGRAPGWRICCSRCGMSAPAAVVGITRLGAVSSQKYIGGWCRNCGGPRWYRLIKDLDQVTLLPVLGLSGVPDDLRSAAHRPWSTVFSILGLVAASLVVGFGTIVLIQRLIAPA